MVLAGGLVAGIRAGFAYNTFPRMNGHWVPPEILTLEPWYRNFTNNMATVQFDHRLLAISAGAPGAVVRVANAPNGGRPPAPARRAADLFLALLVVQIALGIATLLLVVPLAACRCASGRRGAAVRGGIECAPRAALTHAR